MPTSAEVAAVIRETIRKWDGDASDLRVQIEIFKRWDTDQAADLYEAHRAAARKGIGEFLFTKDDRWRMAVHVTPSGAMGMAPGGKPKAKPKSTKATVPLERALSLVLKKSGKKVLVVSLMEQMVASGKSSVIDLAKILQRSGKEKGPFRLSPNGSLLRPK